MGLSMMRDMCLGTERGYSHGGCTPTGAYTPACGLSPFQGWWYYNLNIPTGVCTPACDLSPFSGLVGAFTYFD